MSSSSTAVATVPVTPLRAHTTTDDTSDFGQMMEMAKVLVATGFLPAAIKTPAQAVAIILTGRELGIPTMHALRSINIIQGKPALSSELQLALFHRAGGKSQLRKSDHTTCAMWFRHPNGPEYTATFTTDDARRAQLLDKEMWKKYPTAMLRARCISAGLRIVAPDIVAGVYDPEELGFVVPETPAPESAPALPEAAAPTTGAVNGLGQPVANGEKASEEQIARLLDLIADPHCTEAARQRVDECLRDPAGLPAKTAAKWITSIEQKLAEFKAASDPFPDEYAPSEPSPTREVEPDPYPAGNGLGLTDRRPSRRSPQEAGH